MLRRFWNGAALRRSLPIVEAQRNKSTPGFGTAATASPTPISESTTRPLDKGPLTIGAHPVIAEIFPHLPAVVRRQQRSDPSATGGDDDPPAVERLFSFLSISLRARWDTEPRIEDPNANEEVDEDEKDADSGQQGTAASSEAVEEEDDDCNVAAKVAVLRRSMVDLRASRAQSRGAIAASADDGSSRPSSAPRVIADLSRAATGLRDHALCKVLMMVQRFDGPGAAEILLQWLRAHKTSKRWPTEDGLTRSPLALYGVQLGALHSHELLREWCDVLVHRAGNDPWVRRAWCTGAERDGVVPLEECPMVKWVVTAAIVEQRVLAGSIEGGSFRGYFRVTSRLMRRLQRSRQRDSSSPLTASGASPSSSTESTESKTAFFESLVRDVEQALHLSDRSAVPLARDLVSAVLPPVLEQQMPQAAKSTALPGMSFSLWHRLWTRYFSEQRRQDRTERLATLSSRVAYERAEAEVADERVRLRRAAEKRGGGRHLSEADRDVGDLLHAEVARRRKLHDEIDTLHRVSARARLRERDVSPAGVAFLLGVCSAEAEKQKLRVDDVDRGVVVDMARQLMQQYTARVFERFAMANGSSATTLQTGFDEHRRSSPSSGDGGNVVSAAEGTSTHLPRLAVFVSYLDVLAKCGDLRVVGAVVDDALGAGLRTTGKALCSVARRAVLKQPLMAAGDDPLGLTVVDTRSALESLTFLVRLEVAYGGGKPRNAFIAFRTQLIRLLIDVGLRRPVDDELFRLLDTVPRPVDDAMATEVDAGGRGAPNSTSTIPNGGGSGIPLDALMAGSSASACDAAEKIATLLRQVFRDALNEASPKDDDAPEEKQRKNGGSAELEEVEEEAEETSIDKLAHLLSSAPLPAALQLIAGSLRGGGSGARVDLITVLSALRQVVFRSDTQVLATAAGAEARRVANAVAGTVFEHHVASCRRAGRLPSSEAQEFVMAFGAATESLDVLVKAAGPIITPRRKVRGSKVKTPQQSEDNTALVGAGRHAYLMSRKHFNVTTVQAVMAFLRKKADAIDPASAVSGENQEAATLAVLLNSLIDALSQSSRWPQLVRDAPDVPELMHRLPQYRPYIGEVDGVLAVSSTSSSSSSGSSNDVSLAATNVLLRPAGTASHQGHGDAGTTSSDAFDTLRSAFAVDAKAKASGLLGDAALRQSQARGTAPLSAAAIASSDAVWSREMVLRRLKSEVAAYRNGSSIGRGSRRGESSKRAAGGVAPVVIEVPAREGPVGDAAQVTAPPPRRSLEWLPRQQRNVVSRAAEDMPRFRNQAASAFHH